MTVDSRKKRTSVAGLPFMPLYPKPDSGITADDRIMAAGEYAIHPWVSAAGHDASSEDDWDNPENAYDDNTGTFASEKVQSAQVPIYLEWDSPAPRTDKIRIFAHDVDIIAGTHDASGVKIEVWDGSVWYEVGSSLTLPEDQWYEISIGKNIWGDRVRITSEDDEEYLYIAGVQFINLDALMPDVIFPKTCGGLTYNPRIGGSLVR